MGPRWVRRTTTTRLTDDDVRAVLGDDARLLPLATGWSRARLGDRVIDFSTTGVDLADPLAAGLFDLESGRLPEAAGEVVVNDAMLDKGFAVGDDDGGRRVHAAHRRIGPRRDLARRAGRPRAPTTTSRTTPPTSASGWSRPARCPGRRSRELNQVGAVVTSRAVLADPPDVASMAEQMGYDTGRSETPRGRRADHRDGPHRGRPARRTGVRGRRPPARADPRADRRLGRHARAGAPRDPRQRGRARPGRLRRSGWCSASSRAGRFSRSCSGSRRRGSDPSSCRGATSPPSRASACVAARARLAGAGVAGEPAGRRRGAGRTSRRPPPARLDPGRRAGPARRRHRDLGLRRGDLRQRQRRRSGSPPRPSCRCSA